jgi:translation initiation factor IF-1
VVLSINGFQVQVRLEDGQEMVAFVSKRVAREMCRIIPGDIVLMTSVDSAKPRIRGFSPMNAARRILRQYDRGNLTKNELFYGLMRLATEANAAELARWLPRTVQEEVKAYIAGCPRTEEGWAHMRSFHAGAVIMRTPADVEAYQARQEEERCLHRRGVELLRDIFGPSPTTSLPAAVLAWNDGCIVKLATGIYEERDFSPQRMGVLADALEEAGVADEEVLGHLRGPGLHCRGCWVVDLLTGRE